MENPQLEYQILCANHNTIKKLERHEYCVPNEGTIKAIEKRLQRSAETSSERQLDASVDDMLARERAATQFRLLRSYGDDGRCVGPKSMDGSGCASDISINEFTFDSTFRSGEKHGDQGHGDQASDRTASGWADQADGFKR